MSQQKIDTVMQREDNERAVSCKQAFKSLQQDADLPEWEGFSYPAKTLLVRGGSGQVHVGDVLRGVFPTLAYLKSRDMRVVLASSPGLEKIFGEWKDTLHILNGNASPEEITRNFLAENGEASVKWRDLARKWKRKLQDSFDEENRPVMRTPSLQPDIEQSRSLREQYSEGFTKKVMGIVWRTSMIGRDSSRNANLRDFKQIMWSHSKEWNFVSLQYGSLEMTQQEIMRFNNKRRNVIFDGRIDPMKDYVGAAAQMASCDHIISIDCSQAFQAGAFGVPVSVLISKEGRQSYCQKEELGANGICPFFPETAYVFSQKEPGRWDAPILKAWNHATESVERRGAWNHAAAQAVKKGSLNTAHVIPLAHAA